MAHICRTCGTHLESRLRFCVQCGTPVAQADPTSSASNVRGTRQPGDRYRKAFALTLILSLVALSALGTITFLTLRDRAATDVAATPAPAPASTTEPVGETGRTPVAEATTTDPAPTTTSAAAAPSLAPETTQARPPTTRPPIARPPTQRAQATRPGSQWPAYSYSGPADLCRTPTFPEPALIKVGSGYKPAAHSAEAALVALGYDGVVVDGFFDASSAAALTRFQSNHGLVADGTLGQQSWTRLRGSLQQYAKC